MFRIIESIPSKNAEPIKQWLAKLGSERIDEVFDPSIAIQRSIDLYRAKGYDENWIAKRMKSIQNRKQLTDVWKENGIEDAKEYAILTNEIYKTWSGMTCKEYKEYKGLRKENLRDNMDSIELILTDLSEEATKRLAEKHKPIGLDGNIKVAKVGGNVAKVARDELESNLGESIITSSNRLDYEYDNKEIIRKLVNDRLALAQLMGYPNYAAFELSHKMAKNADNVYKLLNQLLDAYKPVAINEYNAVQGFAMGMEQQNMQVMPWDWSYYSEKLKDLRFKVNDEMTRPYFQLENVKKGVFGLATQLYGLTFKENKKIPVYDKEVQAYEVYDAEGNFKAVLYTDFFPREGKQSGAWMNGIRSQYRDAKGKDVRPQIIIVMNFTRPTDTKPSLLTFDEVETLLHEFGHALHGICADGTYASLSGTSVYQDFVELPSQIMENWLTEKEFLDQIAVHYQTGEKIPQEMIQSLVNASNFNAGYLCCRQLSFGLLDMAWHTLEQPFDGDVAAFEKKAWAPTVIMPEVPEALMGTSFGHIFSGGYAAGYYGYKWAEVLDADAFSVFKSKGIFNKEVAKSFRDNILSKGGTEDPAVLYKRFRGQEPTIDALLIRNGIKK